MDGFKSPLTVQLSLGPFVFVERRVLERERVEDVGWRW